MKYLVIATIVYLIMITTITVVTNIPLWLAQIEHNITKELENSLACEPYYSSMGDGLKMVTTCS